MLASILLQPEVRLASLCLFNIIRIKPNSTSINFGAKRASNIDRSRYARTMTTVAERPEEEDGTRGMERRVTKVKPLPPTQLQQ